MRIISGEKKGFKLSDPPPPVRPMRDMVREAMFSIIGFPDDDDYSFADFFAGSGAVGLEALSRGYSSADFVELSPKSCTTISANIKLLGYEKRSKVIKENVFYFIKSANKSGKKYNTIFCGTPYITEVCDMLFSEKKQLVNMLKPGGILIIQTPFKAYKQSDEDFNLRKFGDDALYFYYMEDK
jgi:16S rRNA (guanine(966)-N(2))-methyltransferase RsmD